MQDERSSKSANTMNVRFTIARSTDGPAEEHGSRARRKISGVVGSQASVDAVFGGLVLLLLGMFLPDHPAASAQCSGPNGYESLRSSLSQNLRQRTVHAAGTISPQPGRASDGVTRGKVIIDTDIGDDVDDAFALALAVESPELQILGVTTTFGDTEARARIADRFLGEVRHTENHV